MALQVKDFSVSRASASGTITYTYILRVTENSAGLVNGKPVSNVTIQAILKQTYSGTAFSTWTTYYTCTVNGSEKFSASAQRDLSGTSEHVYYTWVGDIEHNADGTLPITVGGSLWVVDPGQYKPQKLTIVEDSNNVMVLTPVIVNTACTAPTSVSISPSVFEDKVEVSWSGASGGQNNHITGYDIYCAYSADNQNWSDWVYVLWTEPYNSYFSFDLDWLTRHGINVSRGNYLKFLIRTLGSAGEAYHSAWKEIGVVRRNPYSACTAPTSFTVSPEIVEEGQPVTLSWEGAAGGSNNAITGYEIQFTCSQDGVNWNTWTYFKTPDGGFSFSGNSAIDVPGIPRGWHEKYRIRTQGSAGSDCYSEWKESNVIRKNSIPVTPVAPLLSTSTFRQGDAVTVSWDGAFDLDNNLSSYRIYYGINDIWTLLDEVTLDRLQFEFVPTQVENKASMSIGVTAVDALGAESPMAVAGVLTRNDASAAAVTMDGSWQSAATMIGWPDGMLRCASFVGINGTWVKCSGGK